MITWRMALDDPTGAVKLELICFTVTRADDFFLKSPVTRWTISAQAKSLFLVPTGFKEERGCTNPTCFYWALPNRSFHSLASPLDIVSEASGEF